MVGRVIPAEAAKIRVNVVVAEAEAEDALGAPVKLISPHFLRVKTRLNYFFSRSVIPGIARSRADQAEEVGKMKIVVGVLPLPPPPLLLLVAVVNEAVLVGFRCNKFPKAVDLYSLYHQVHHLLPVEVLMSDLRLRQCLLYLLVQVFVPVRLLVEDLVGYPLLVLLP